MLILFILLNTTSGNSDEIFCDQSTTKVGQIVNNGSQLNENLMNIKLTNLFTEPIYTIFDVVKKLQKLDVSNSNVALFHYKNPFENASSLTILLAANTSVTYLNDNAFYGATQLLQICLENNKISTISSIAFQDLSLLEELHLSNNFLTTVEHRTFCPLTSLKSLWLNNNFIINLSFLNFAVNTNLTDLKVSYNLMITLSISELKVIENTKLTSKHKSLQSFYEYVRKCHKDSILQSDCNEENNFLDIDEKLHKFLQVSLLGLIAFFIMILVVIAMRFSCNHKHNVELIPKKHKVMKLTQINHDKDNEIEMCEVQANGNICKSNSTPTLYSDPTEMYPFENCVTKSANSSITKIRKQMEMNDMKSSNTPDTFIETLEKSCAFQFNGNSTLSRIATIDRKKKANENLRTETFEKEQIEKHEAYVEMIPKGKPEHIYEEIKNM